MIELKNEVLTITIREVGAEITSIIDNKSGFEFLWQGDPDIWKGQAPILFPFIGKLKKGTYSYQDQIFKPNKHGFARDMEFYTQSVTENSASFYLKSSPATKEIYPFDFSLQVTYILSDNHVTVSYEVLNTSHKETLYYALGGHPAFNVAMDPGTEDFADLDLDFVPEAKYLRIPVNRHGLMTPNKAKYEDLPANPIQKAKFNIDTYVFQISKRTQVRLTDRAHGVEILVKPNEMNYLGVWYPYPKPAKLIAIEPWTGLPDRNNASGILEEKQEMTALEPQAMNIHGFTLELKKQ